MLNRLWEIVYMIAGAIMGTILTMITQYVINKVKGIYQLKRVQKNIYSLKNVDKIENISVLVCGYPYFSISNLDIEQAEFDCRLSLPKGFDDCIPDSVGRFVDVDTEDSKFILSKLFAYGLTVDEFNKIRQTIAEEFANKNKGFYFNGPKLGVCYFDDFSRTCDIDEKPILTIRTFQTDYYTHQVITSAMMKKNIMILPGSLNSNEKFFNTFCTAIGLSVILVIPGTNQIILTKRGKNTAYSNGKTYIYVSVTEAFTKSDIGFDGRPSFESCLRRGIFEELGIPDSKLSLDSIKFYDLFFEEHFLQMGLVVSLNLDASMSLQDIINRTAKDKKLETQEIFTINNTVRAIEDFIELHHDEMRAQTIFALKSYVSRL